MDSWLFHISWIIEVYIDKNTPKVFLLVRKNTSGRIYDFYPKLYEKNIVKL